MLIYYGTITKGPMPCLAIYYDLNYLALAKECEIFW